MSRTIRFGHFEVDLAAGQLHKRGVRIGLREKSFQVLALLLERPGEVVTREQLRHHLWPSDVFVDFENNLNTSVARLREALGDSAERPRFIETLPRHGYRFIAALDRPPEGDRASRPAVRVGPRPPTQDRDAYDEYLQGRSHLGRVTPDGFSQARQHFEVAISRDPGFALAYDGLAEVYWYLGYFGFTSPKEAFSTGVLYAVRALEIDSSLGETHALLGLYHKQLAYDWPEVAREMARALELSPTSPIVRERYAFNFLMPHARHEEATAELELALEWDPQSLSVRAHLGAVLLLWRKYDRAMDQARRVIELEPRAYWGHALVGSCFRDQGIHEKAISSYRRAVDLSGESSAMLGWLGQSLALGGHTDEAHMLLERLHERAGKGYVPPTSFAWIHLGLDQIDPAFEWLDRAIEVRDQFIMPIKSYWFLDRIRTDPRFSALQRKMRLDA